MEAEKTERIEATEKHLFGDILIKRGQVRRYQLDFALALQKAYRKIARPVKIGELLVQHRAISDNTREATASLQLDLPLEPATAVDKHILFDDEEEQTQVLRQNPF